MGNDCSGCCGSSPVPNSQFPPESAPQTQSPTPQLPCQSQVETPTKTQSPTPQLPCQSLVESTTKIQSPTPQLSSQSQVETPSKTQSPTPQQPPQSQVESPNKIQSSTPQLSSQSQVESPPQTRSPPKTQSPTPQLPSQSQVKVDDLKQLYANIKDSTELDHLIRHVKHLLSVIEKAQSPQDVKKYTSIDFVQSMIESAAKFLEAISTQGEALKNDKLALNRTGGMQTAISTALKRVGELHWIAVGFSAIAYVMDIIQQVTSNFKQCVRLLHKLVGLAERLQVLHQRMAPHEAERLNEAVHAIVEGAILCCCCMSQRKIFKYLFSSIDKATLQDIGTAIDELHRSLILMVAMDIQQQIPRRYYASDPQAPFGAVGIDDKIEKIIQLLDMQSKGPARAVILYGFGGAGKTTLGDCVVSKLKRVFDLRGMKYSRIQLGEKKLHKVQQDLYAELTKEELRFTNFKDGQEKLKEVLEKETAFIFVDNVLTKDQINDLLPPQLYLPSGSRLLVTARNVNVTEELRCRNIVCDGYRVDGLPYEAAKKYFRQIVIRSEEIALALDEGRISLHKMDAVAEKCRGVPLLLKVYAQYLERHGSDSRVYDEILDRLQQGEFSFTDAHLGDILLYVYHQLDDEYQEAFVDICTYFHGWDEEDVCYIVSRTVLNGLIDGALVKIDVSNKIIVHDVLKAMGMKEGKKTRIQDVNELKNSQEMKGIWLCNSKRLFTLESKILLGMKDCLRVIALGRKIRLASECNLPFSKLRFLQIENLHGPPIFCSEFLGALRYMRIKTREFPESVSSSKLSQRIWMNIKSLGHLQKFAFESLGIKMFPNDFQLPTSLIELDLSNCKELQQLPQELGSLTRLKKLILDGCQSLKILPAEFSKLRSLTYLSMKDCAGLQALPTDFGQLSSLGRLNISGSSHLGTLGADFGCLSSLESLNISDLAKLAALPESFGGLSNLRNLTIKRCHSLRSLPLRFGDLGTLQSLDLSDCKGLTGLPDRFGQFNNLQSLNLSECSNLMHLPDGLCQLSNLQSLNLARCERLANLPGGLGNLSNLQSLCLVGCKGLTNLPGGLGKLSNLQSLNLVGCKGLANLPGGLGQLSKLQDLILMDCSKLTSLPPEIGRLGNLKYLFLGECPGLRGLPHELGDVASLKYLKLRSCSELTSLPDVISRLSNLRVLDLRGCSSLMSLPKGLGYLSNLKSLDLSHCSKLTRLPDDTVTRHLTSLQSLHLSGCEGLTNLPDRLGHLVNLKFLDLDGCRGLGSLPDVLGHLSELEYLHLRECSTLISLPNGFGNLKLLRGLWLSGCTNLSILPENFGKLCGLKHLEMAKCCALKVLPNDFENLRSVVYLDLSYCSELEGNTIERVVKLPNLKVLDIRHSPNLTRKWNEMERGKFAIWVKSVEILGRNL